MSHIAMSELRDSLENMTHIGKAAVLQVKNFIEQCTCESKGQ
jgi:hypothetical protein